MKKILITILIIATLLIASCKNGDLTDELGEAWTHDLGAQTITLTDNFEYGSGYQATFNPDGLFKGDKVTKGAKYTLQITFTASRNLEGLLFAGLVDQNPAASQPNPYWTELAYTQGPDVEKDKEIDAETISIDDASDVARGVQFVGQDSSTIIKANEEITAEIKWTALRDSSGEQPNFNSIYFQTRGVGTTGKANSGKEGSVTLNFSKFIFIKEAEKGVVIEETICECPEGTKHFEDNPCSCEADTCECLMILRPATSYKVISPYSIVNWDTWDQYKAALHVHTSSSDGNTTITTQVNRYYELGYDILAITDHNYQGQPVTTNWLAQRNVARGDENMTQARYDEVTTGVGRTPPRPIVPITNTSEIACYPDEINTFWWAGAPAQNNWSQTRVLDAVKEAGGVASINHPGRATGGSAKTIGGFYASMKKAQINRYAGYFLDYDNLTIMEIINRADGDSYHDRVLWDNILQITARQGKNVFGRADDDAHSSSTDSTGLGWNMFIMPANNEANIKTAMLNGTFYAVSRNAHREGVSNRSGTAPALNKIAISNDDSIDASITLTVQHADRVDFITERQGSLGYYCIVHTANRPTGTASTASWEATIELKSAKNARDEIVGCFVRANIVGSGGIAFVQPFIIERELDLSGN